MLLSENYQSELKDRHFPAVVADLDRYHFFDLPDGSVRKGEWDLRKTWREYLGGIDFDGLRVLEVGPASGFLSLQMEKAGAEVVSLDVGIDVPQDLISVPGQDDGVLSSQSPGRIDKFRRAWWHWRDVFNSKNKAVYASIYDVPDIGHFDVAVFASVLLHVERPYEALREASRRSDAIIVTELFDPTIAEQEVMRFMPTGEPWLWWTFSPNVLQRMLWTLGFSQFRTTHHSHTQHRFFEYPGREDEERLVDLFTVVATRTGCPRL